MKELISIVIYFAQAVIAHAIGFNSFRELGIVSTVITITMIFVWIWSYYSYTAEYNMYTKHEIYPFSCQLQDFEVIKLKNKIYNHIIISFVSYYIAIPCGLVSIVFILSNLFDLIQ